MANILAARGQSNPTKQAKTDYRFQRTTIPVTLPDPVAYQFSRDAGTFEVYVNVGGDAAPGVATDFSFFVQGGYGLPTAEVGRQYYSQAGNPPRNCSITSETINSATFQTTIVVQPGPNLVARTWAFVFCSYSSIPPTFTYVGPAASDVTITVVDTVGQNGWW